MSPKWEEIYNSIECCELFLEEQKAHRKNKKARSTDVLKYINCHLLKEVKTRRKNVAMTRINYKNPYDNVPENWILEYLKTYKITDKEINFITNVMDE